MSRIHSLLSTINHRYDAENDVTPGAPMVTWADYSLAECIEELESRIYVLERRINSLEATE